MTDLPNSLLLVILVLKEVVHWEPLMRKVFEWEVF